MINQFEKLTVIILNSNYYEIKESKKEYDIDIVTTLLVIIKV